MLEKLKTIKIEIVVILVLIALGIFVRSYHFADWLHFEIDQSYDTLLVSPGVDQGIGSLPLLGPTAGGGRSLRLGPAFYYIEYVSAKIFGNTPPGHAGLVLVFSILSLPLFYILCRRYFTKQSAIGLLAIFSVSLYLVLYARFSWSPNILPFFIMLVMYALLRSVSLDEERRETWFLIAVATIAIITQIHFNAFFIVPPVVFLFLILKRPHFRWRTWLVAVAIFLVVYSPVIISDIKMNGQNTMYFFQKLNQGGQHSTKLPEKFIQILQYQSSEYFLIDTGIDKINGKKLSGYAFQASSTLLWRMGALLLFILELFVLARNIKTEKTVRRKDFLIFSGLLFVVSFAYFFSIIRSSFNIYPRFFLLVSPLAIILLGLLLEMLQPERDKKRLAVFASIIILLCASNLMKIKTYFSQLAHTQGQMTVMTEDVLPNTARATLAEQYAIADFIESKQKENGYPVYLNAKHEYESVFWYHLEKRHILFHEYIKNDVAYQEANYFLITFADKGLSTYASRFTIADERNFGVFSVYVLRPNPDAITAIRQTSAGDIPIQRMQIDALFTWNKLRSSSWNATSDAAAEVKIEQAETKDVQNDVSQGLSSGDQTSSGSDTTNNTDTGGNTDTTGNADNNPATNVDSLE
jgi:hypothetical protein